MQIPQKGYYYHYKHDPKSEINNYAYEVIGVAKNTENDSYEVIYRPLYKGKNFGVAEFWARPLEMFMEDVELNGKVVKRFTKIEDKEVLKQLSLIKNQF